MTMPAPDDPDLQALTAHQAMSNYRAALKRLGELAVEEIDHDLARVEGLDYFQQMVLRTKWMKEVELWSAVRSSMTRYATAVGEQELGVDGSDVDGRLERYKKHLAAEFERRVNADVDLHGITSPVGKIFVMEWHFTGAGEKSGARMVPQKKLTRDGRALPIDFMMEAADGTRKLAIELARNDFNEEQRQQAVKDRQRELTPDRHGCSLFRFTALEVVRDPRRCIDEVVDAFNVPRAATA